MKGVGRRGGGPKGGCIYNRRVQADENSQIILAENLEKVYAAGKLEVKAVRGVSLKVEKGEFVAIVGPSGSGKSTLFYLLGGLTRASAGRVVIDGVDFATLDDAQRTRLRKHRIGFVFQKFNLLPTLSAMGNIEIAYEISGRKEPLDRGYLDHLSDMLSIKGRLEHRPAELSGGEQQRVAIARALVTKPAIVLADEPTGNLDTQNSDAVLQMLMRSNRELGQTTLMITHNPEAAAVARLLPPAYTAKVMALMDPDAAGSLMGALPADYAAKVQQIAPPATQAPAPTPT